MIYPPALSPGDTIGVMAPSSYIERADVEASAAFLEARGYKVFVHPQTYLRDRQSAGTIADKAGALRDLFCDSDIRAIWTAGGGNRALHILEALDYELIAAHPKAVVGCSDVTALLNALYARAGLVCFHGPVFRQLHLHEDPGHILGLLAGDKAASCVPLGGDVDVLREGAAQGPLIGGNLSLFQYLPQTLPQTLPGAFCKGAILCLEDCNEELSRLDRMFLHLRRIGVLGGIAGLVLGEFTGLKDTGDRPFGFSLRDLVLEHTQGLDIPVVMGLSFGHGRNLYGLPVGGRAALNTAERIFQLQLHLPCPPTAVTPVVSGNL